MTEKQQNRLRALVMAAQDMYVLLHGEGSVILPKDLKAMQHQRAIFDAADALAEISEEKARRES